MKRGHFSKGVIETLLKRVGGLCSNPMCNRTTIGPSEKASSESTTVGVAAHIRGAQPNSSRYDSSQSEEDRHSIDNGIWLCEFCASLVDKNKGVDYSVETLKTWKGLSTKASRERLVSHSESVKAGCIGTLIYINVPRLIHLDALFQSHPTFPHIFENGIPSTGQIVHELVDLKRAIDSMKFPALDWKEVIASIREPEAMTVSFEDHFWTKNGPKSRESSNTPDMTNLKTAPHIYTKHAGLRFILPYDPKYLTTNTATSEFSSGRIRVGGFAVIKKRHDKEVWASPLFIGLWQSPEVRTLMDAMRPH